MKIGIIFADEMEYMPFKELASKEAELTEKVRRGNESLEATIGGHDVIAVRSGIGKVNAAAAASFLIAGDGVDMVINAGLAGGLKNVKRGQIVCGESTIECDFDLTVFNYPMGKKPGEDSEKKFFSSELNDGLIKLFPDIKTAPLGCGDFFMHGNKSEEYVKLFDIDVFDMESGAVASVCTKAGVACMSLKKISDGAGEDAPEQYRDMNDMADRELSDVIIEYIKSLK